MKMKKFLSTLTAGTIAFSTLNTSLPVSAAEVSDVSTSSSYFSNLNCLTMALFTLGLLGFGYTMYKHWFGNKCENSNKEFDDPNIQKVCIKHATKEDLARKREIDSSRFLNAFLILNKDFQIERLDKNLKDSRAEGCHKCIYIYNEEPESPYRHEAEYHETNDRPKLDEKCYGDLNYIGNPKNFYDLALANRK